MTDAPARPHHRRWHRYAVAAVMASALTGTGVTAAANLGDTTPTATVRLAPVAATAIPTGESAAAPEAAAPAAPASGPGYRIVNTDGGVFSHGWMPFEGSAAGESPSPTVGIAHTADGEGYWLASADGGVFAFGTAPFFGSATGTAGTRIVDVAATPTGQGYWLVSRDGGVFAFGDAGYFGAGPELGLTGRVASIASTPTGLGYWLVDERGGVYAFGDAGFFGSLGDQPLNGGITALVPTNGGQGYYLVATDGGVFTYGDASFHGSAIDAHLTGSIVDMALYPDGSGYWLLSSDGGVFSYGDAPFLGAPVNASAGKPFAAIAAGVGRQAPPAVTATADAAPEPAAAPAPAPAEVAAAAPAPAAELAAPAAPTAPPAAAGKVKAASAKAKGNAKKDKAIDHEFGWDISYPQCGGNYPDGASSYVIVGVTGGRAFRTNRCLAEQWQWARARGAAGVYVNVNFPRTPDELARGATSDRQPDCAPDGISCVAYNFGVNGIRDALAYARSSGVDVPFVWLDVEQLNYWTPDRALNAVVLRGAIDAVREVGLEVGIYSTPFQFRKIMGDEQPGVPVWTAGANGLGAHASYCAERGFGGGPVALVQFLPGQFDPNLACPGAGSMSHYFTLPD